MCYARLLNSTGWSSLLLVRMEVGNYLVLSWLLDQHLASETETIEWTNDVTDELPAISKQTIRSYHIMQLA